MLCYGLDDDKLIYFFFYENLFSIENSLRWSGFAIEPMFRINEQTIVLFGHIINMLTGQNMAWANLPLAANHNENWSTTFEMNIIFQISLEKTKFLLDFNKLSIIW